jgi:shikimate kinase
VTRPVVVLVGPPASGKSTVMRRLARALQVHGRDTDSDVEAHEGATVAAIFAERGEAAFRELERAAVAEALETHDGVLALGGGAVLDAETRRRLRAYADAGGTVVFLDVSAGRVAARIASDTSRPLLAGDALARWRELMAARRPLYEEVATLRVETDDGGPRSAVTTVLAHVGPRADPEQVVEGAQG